MAELVIYGAAALIVFLAGLLMTRAATEPPEPPHPERPPAEHEVKSALAEVQSDVRALHAKMTRCAESADGEFRAIERRLERIESGQAAAAAARLNRAMGAMERE